MGIHMRLVMALSYLRDHDGAPQQELAEALCMDANNVELTESGRRTLIDAERAQETIEDEVLEGLNAEDRATLWRLLTIALTAAEHHTPERELVASAT